VVPQSAFEGPLHVVGLRLLNASLADSITVSRSDSAAFTQVASDAGLLPTPLSITSLRVSPGERAEIIIDLTADERAPRSHRGAGRSAV